LTENNYSKLELLQNYIINGNKTVTLNDYKNAGIKDVIEDNLDSYNELLLNAIYRGEKINKNTIQKSFVFWTIMT